MNIKVVLFGKFQIQADNEILDEEAIRSEMVTKLLVYLLLHRKENLTIPAITEALWWNCEADNPAGALKNLVYRLRTVLKKNFGDREYILTKQGSYSWNPEISVELDSELFEEYFGKIKEAEDKALKRTLCEKAERLYKGAFMKKLCGEHYIIPLATWYHSAYLSIVKQLAEIYMDEENYEAAEKLLSHALNYDYLDEYLNAVYISALAKQNKHQMAMEHYKRATKAIYDELGVREPQELKKVYEELLQMNYKDVQAPIEDIQEDMNEEEEVVGAFLCGYPVFREMYRLEARRMRRMGVSEYILLVTLDLKNRLDMGSEAEAYARKMAMNRMEDTLQSSLRIGDVVARYSDSQFVVMLPTCNFETGSMIADRVLGNFRKDARNYNISVEFDLEEISETNSKYVRKES